MNIGSYDENGKGTYYFYDVGNEPTIKIDVKKGEVSTADIVNFVNHFFKQ